MLRLSTPDVGIEDSVKEPFNTENQLLDPEALVGLSIS